MKVVSYSRWSLNAGSIMLIEKGVVVSDQWSLNSLPYDKILDVTKLRAFAGNKINVAQMMIFVFDRVENIVGKGENAGYQHFLLFPTMFSKCFFLGVVKSPDCEVKS